MDKEIPYTIKSSEKTNSGISFVICSTNSSNEKHFSFSTNKAVIPELLKILEPGTPVCISNNEIFIVKKGTRKRLADLIVTIEMNHGHDPYKTEVDNRNSWY